MIRKFYLVNESGQTYTLFGHGRDRTDIEQLSGLGFELEMEYSDLGGRFVETKRSVPQGSISMTLVFHLGYEGFARWRDFVTKSSDLRLFYSYGEAKYCHVAVRSSSKAQLESGILRSSVVMDRLSLWLVNRSASLSVKKTDEGKTYRYSYPYTYAVSYNGKVAVENACARDVPLRLTMSGNCLNPRVIVYQNGAAKGTMRLLLDERERPTITVSADPADQYIKRKVGALEEDIYALQDFSCENFLSLPPGKSEVFFDPGVREPATLLIEYKEEYLAH